MLRLTTIIAASALLTSCAVLPEKLDSSQVASYADDKLSRVTAGQEPITAPLTLYAAMARAIKYNLDYQVELYDEALSNAKLGQANVAGLPKLVANSLYSGRDSYDASYSSGLLPNPVPGIGNGSTSEEKNSLSGDLTLSWNILDFGLSYVRAKQASDEVLIAQERRRKIINRVIEDVRTAYWRAVSADRLMAGLRRLERRAERALANSRSLQNDGTSSPLTELTYQRELVEIQQAIQGLQNDLSVAKTQLSALMNVKPGTKYTLAQPRRALHDLKFKLSAERSIEVALNHRPELLEVQYRERINSQEAEAALLELLPSLNLFAGANFDTNDYLVNNDWVSWGARASWNAMKVFTYPKRKRVVDAQGELLDRRALALTMAIMTQVHVSRIRYYLARKRFVTARKHLNIQQKILYQIRESAAADQASQQTLIREEMNTLASKARYDIAFAELQNTFANIFSAMGLDPYAHGYTGNESLQDLTHMLRHIWVERGDRSGSRKANKTRHKHGDIVAAN